MQKITNLRSKRLGVLAVKSLFMRRLLLIILVLSFPALIVAQEKISMKGKVSDASTKQSLPFAQISLAGTTLGTVTNDDGLFRLMMPDAGKADTLMVSFLGYRMGKIPVTSFDSGIMEIFLEPVSFDLREVEVIALTPLEVLRRAFDSIPSNYGMDSVILTAFIRTQKTVNNKLAEYTEAIVENLKTGYSYYKPAKSGTRHQASNIPFLYKGRVTSDTNLVNLLGEVGASARCLGCNFVHDIAEFPYGTLLDTRDQKHYIFHMDELVNPEGGKIYRIRFDQSDETNKMLHQGEILVGSRDFAILQVTYKPSFKAYETYEKNKFKRTWYLNNQPGWIQEMPLGETIISYARRGDFWALSTIRNRYWVTYIQPEERLRIKYGYVNEVVVTGVIRDPEIIREFRGDKSIGVNQRWDEVVGETDETFWENFNYLPIEEKLKEAVEGLIEN